MFLPLKVGLQFSRSKKKTIMSGFISIASIVGITIGVAALIIGLSAMNGFEKEVSHRVLGVMPVVEVRSMSGYFDDADKVAEKIQDRQGITAASPGMVINAMLNHDNRYRSARITAVNAADYRQVVSVDEFMVNPNVTLADLKPDEDGVEGPKIVLGFDLARKLEVAEGDSVELIVTKNNSNGTMSAPLGINCRVVGVFRIGGQLDSVIAYVDLSTIRSLLGMEKNQSSSIFVKTDSFFNSINEARTAVMELVNSVSTPMGLQSWMDQAAPLYRDIQMIRTVMCLALLLVIVVSCFNIVSSLIMSVNEKRSEVAILISMGYSRFQVMQTFVVQGLFSGIYGTVFGVLFGLVIAINLTEVINFIQNVFGIRILKSETYFMDYVPTSVNYWEVLAIAAVCILIALLAAVLPGIKAAYINPATELSGK
ncbi:FtsX-like permease family protein [uncultured Ruminobacter sp.]|jgi:lipoprotein-releasing system permease protein|uniref:FtsX-like permease family protein n=2 Tax=Ruminobacter sp. TaxID=2774296 RepID=UPI0025FD0775|nr:FtsX-like permease family protein [uncultured Ruminobacter sp.]